MGYGNSTDGATPRRFKVRATFVTNTVVPLAAMVTAGMGIGLLPRYCVEKEVAEGAVVRVLSGYAGPSRIAYAIYPHARYLPKKVRVFLDFAKTARKHKESAESEDMRNRLDPSVGSGPTD